jgi:uridylate kinase
MLGNRPCKRVLLKLSGEALMGDQKFGLDHVACHSIAREIKQVYDEGVQIGIVVGGGNIFRGLQAREFGFARTPADHIGMLGTTINGLVLQQSLVTLGCESRVLSALPCSTVVETYNWGLAMDYLQKNIITIFVGGTGNPYFTTDSAGALRANEIEADMLLKGTKVDGIYDKDPLKHSDAIKYTELTYSEALTKKLNVMDATAIALCRENQIPIYVFNLFEKGAFLKGVLFKGNGSLVQGE